eukprot:TRINITY_DN3917_c0_g1_i1.p1 TRINITY_DN3917_c0_g1~~TRINITY_DN3917_c0_g1_i1.p1  ORF type:complete len:182 (+),score=35.84 TRINITY_DN3917_c0_g1_i1:327-872(+)
MSVFQETVMSAGKKSTKQFDERIMISFNDCKTHNPMELRFPSRFHRIHFCDAICAFSQDIDFVGFEEGFTDMMVFPKHKGVGVFDCRVSATQVRANGQSEMFTIHLEFSSEKILCHEQSGNVTAFNVADILDLTLDPDSPTATIVFEPLVDMSVEQEKNKKKTKKSTDCDSALIPLLCVHG